MTNADRIRSMSDEKLAKFLFDAFAYETMCNFCSPGNRSNSKCDGHCRNGILEWLQQPSEKYISEDIKPPKYISEDIEGDA